MSIKIDNPGLFTARAGQFFMVKINDFNYPFLRRPFSITYFKDYIEIVYKIVGEGTSMLAKKQKGEFIDMIGPLGNGFEIVNSKKILLVGGGIGFAPLRFLKEELKGRSFDFDSFFGFNTKDEVCVDFGNIATMDGSYGYKGSVIDLVKDVIDEETLIYACGPSVVLSKLSDICLEKNAKMQVSLESRMACGIGVCLGCVIETKNGMKKVCDEGPVFDYKEILWEKM